MLSWQKRYRGIVEALVRHTNTVIRAQNISIPFYKDIMLKINEIQVLEYIIEHQEDDEHMIHMANRLSIPQSDLLPKKVVHP